MVWETRDWAACVASVSLRMVNTSVARLGTLRREQWRDTKHTHQCSTQACKLMCICTHVKCANCLGLPVLQDTMHTWQIPWSTCSSRRQPTTG